MSLKKFEQRLQETLDRRQLPGEDPVLRTMAEQSEECRELLAVQDALFEGFALSDLPSLGDDFSQQVVDKVLANRNPSRQPLPLALVLGVVVALLLLLAPVAWFSFYSPEQQGTGDPIVEQTVPTAIEPSEQWVIVDLPENNRPDPETYRDMVDQLALWIQIDAQSVATAAQPVTDTLRPITDSVGSALEAMRRTLPPGRSADLDEPQAGFLPHIMQFA